MKQAGAFGQSLTLMDRKSPRHAEMNEQHLAALDMDEEIFRPPGETQHTPTVEPFGKSLWQRIAQIGAALRQQAIRRPSITGARPRRTVSTSGSSGILSLYLSGCGFEPC